MKVSAKSKWSVKRLLLWLLPRSHTGQWTCLLVNRTCPGQGAATSGFKERASQATRSLPMFLPASAMWSRSAPWPTNPSDQAPHPHGVLASGPCSPLKLQVNASEPSPIHQRGSNEPNFQRLSTYPVLLRGCLALCKLTPSSPATSQAHRGVKRGYFLILSHPSPGATGICVPFVRVTIWNHRVLLS